MDYDGPGPDLVAAGGDRHHGQLVGRPGGLARRWAKSVGYMGSAHLGASASSVTVPLQAAAASGLAADKRKASHAYYYTFQKRKRERESTIEP